MSLQDSEPRSLAAFRVATGGHVLPASPSVLHMPAKVGAQVVAIE
eukprot:CAMPEP_0181187846 /NCGR_PEP_ID=MMETSP1096-20121128/10793_1 /TAXON_ID=156174 ORGANISM="Chrysochromulina ericina, Strain CCMP281" /NCGR_SAMPLE_ID=MMETSP1096 /ASSEMBLY_ACC=CAM_ASM_000453 /LENGTH=44 /DNA_ID= /DNA_START= /DNA_END= /DNA_ORIENTATION=